MQDQILKTAEKLSIPDGKSASGGTADPTAKAATAFREMHALVSTNCSTSVKRHNLKQLRETFITTLCFTASNES